MGLRSSVGFAVVIAGVEFVATAPLILASILFSSPITESQQLPAHPQEPAGVVYEFQ